MEPPMPKTVDYYFAPQSPWTYLGHQRFTEISRAAGATVNVLPADFGQVFAVSGGLPLAQRAPQRQAYRLVELRRFSEALALPLNLHPKHFPVPGDKAARLILAVAAREGSDAAMRLTHAVLRAVWVEERDIGDASTLGALLGETGLPAERLAESLTQTVAQRYMQVTRQAIDAGVFGAPTYVVDGELFWGQDRLDFVERALTR